MKTKGLRALTRIWDWACKNGEPDLKAMAQKIRGTTGPEQIALLSKLSAAVEARHSNVFAAAYEDAPEPPTDLETMRAEWKAQPKRKTTKDTILAQYHALPVGLLRRDFRANHPEVFGSFS